MLLKNFQSPAITQLLAKAKRYVQINRPDGVADILQQIEHGTLALIAQHRALGHAIPGIVEGRLCQYPHLGDGASKTDNKIYSKAFQILTPPVEGGRKL